MTPYARFRYYHAVLNQEDVRHKLAWEYQARCARNPRYSLRAYARSLEVSHSLLSLVLSGKRLASHRMAALFEDKSNAEAYSALPERVFEKIATWTHYAVLGLLDLSKFDPSPKALAKRLGISPVQASQVWDDLVTSGVVELLGKAWVQSTQRLTLNNTASTAATRTHVRGLLKKAEESLDEEKFSARNLTTTTFGMNEADVPYAAEKIKRFRRKLCEDLEKRGKANRVYTLAVQLFPITKNEETP